MISFKCNKCGKQLKVRDEVAGRRVKCSACKAAIQIPKQGATPPLSPPTSKHSVTSTESSGFKKLLQEKAGQALAAAESSGLKKLVQEKAEKAKAAVESSGLKETLSDFHQEAVKVASSHGTKATEKARSFFKDENQEEKTRAEQSDQEQATTTNSPNFLTKFHSLPRSKKFAIAASVILLMFFTGFFPSCSSSSESNTRTKNDGGFLSLGFFAKRSSSLDLTIREFREEISNKEILKSEFYEKYGKPQKVMSLGDNTYLIYMCADGLCRVEVGQILFRGYGQKKETVYTYAVDET